MLICEECGAKVYEADAVRTRVLCFTCAEKTKDIEDPVCDFCSTPNPVWGFPTRTFVDNAPPPTQGQDAAYVSVEDWAACDECKRLIEADDAEALLTRCLKKAPGGDMSRDPFMRFALKGFHAQFFANRDGPPYRHALPNEAGCWVDGHWGQYGMTRVVSIARDRGWPVDQEAIDLTAAWISGEPDANLDAVVDIADKAEEWLNDKVAPRGFCFGWHDGEFFLQPEKWWEDVDA